MWIAVWGLFAVFVMGFVGWTVIILHQQKKAWAAFAKKHKLKYEPGKMMDSAVVTGSLGKRKFSLYTGAQQTDDIRGQRFVTIIEFQMGQGMPTGAAIATQEYGTFLNGLVFSQSFEPDLPEWSHEYILRTRNADRLRSYLNKERQQILHGLFSMKNSACLFFFDELEAVLRIETTDPLRDIAHLEKIVKRLQEAVERLAPTAEEKELYRKDVQATAAQTPAPPAGDAPEVAPEPVVAEPAAPPPAAAEPPLAPPKGKKAKKSKK